MLRGGWFRLLLLFAFVRSSSSAECVQLTVADSRRIVAFGGLPLCLKCPAEMPCRNLCWNESEAEFFLVKCQDISTAVIETVVQSPSGVANVSVCAKDRRRPDTFISVSLVKPAKAKSPCANGGFERQWSSRHYAYALSYRECECSARFAGPSCNTERGNSDLVYLVVLWLMTLVCAALLSFAYWRAWRLEKVTDETTRRAVYQLVGHALPTNSPPTPRAPPPTTGRSTDTKPSPSPPTPSATSSGRLRDPPVPPIGNGNAPTPPSRQSQLRSASTQKLSTIH